jgi:hypothetical protein
MIDVSPTLQPNQPASLTSLTPMLRYRIQEAHGQHHVGYFLPDPKARGKLKMVARTQHRSRNVADARIIRRARSVCMRAKKPWLQYVFTSDTGAFQAFEDEAVAIEAATKSELPCVLYSVDGTWRHL